MIHYLLTVRQTNDFVLGISLQIVAVCLFYNK